MKERETKELLLGRKYWNHDDLRNFVDLLLVRNYHLHHNTGNDSRSSVAKYSRVSIVDLKYGLENQYLFRNVFIVPVLLGKTKANFYPMVGFDFIIICIRV